jgi:HlyD family secretion protein
MTVSVDLTVAARPNALTLASDSVRGITTETPWVLVAENGRLARRDVKLGIRGDGAIEIVSGLAETAEVVIPDGQVRKVGQRVRAAHEER